MTFVEWAIENDFVQAEEELDELTPKCLAKLGAMHDRETAAVEAVDADGLPGWLIGESQTEWME